MNNEMTVFGNSSSDTMIVTNISSPEENSINNTINTFSSNTTQSDPQWSASCNNNNNNSSNTESNVNQTEESFSSPDEALEPIDRLEKYCSSEIIFHRQVVARSILETLNDVDPNDIQRVMAVISRLASDTEPSIRAELVEQLPQIGAYFANQIEILPNAVPLYILPILEQFLTDSNSQVIIS
jgi:serine/threonine-protein phosphatase 4 regulatory subunit 1